MFPYYVDLKMVKRMFHWVLNNSLPSPSPYTSSSTFFSSSPQPPVPLFLIESRLHYCWNN